MGLLDESVSQNFVRWERRGRGWHVWPYPVELEPPFEPYDGLRFSPPDPEKDDGRKPGILASLFNSAERVLNPKPPIISEPERLEPEPELLERDSLTEFQATLPSTLKVSSESFEQFLLNLFLCREPISFELLGQPNNVAVQFAAASEDAPNVRRQLQAHFPEAIFRPRQDSLESAWQSCEGAEALVVEFGLCREFMFPLGSADLDPFIGIIGALSELGPGELGLFQVLFQPVQHPWPENIIRSVSHADGKPFFVNVPELTKAAQNKIAQPLFAAVVRVAVKTETFERSLQIARDVSGSLRVFADPHGNELIPLENSDYPFEEHIEDVLYRQSRRCGMLLNCGELSGFVHLPSTDVRSSVLERESGKTIAAPFAVRGGTGILLGHNNHAGESLPVQLTPEQRVRHTHIIGASGTGKSTLLFNLIRQDIENGDGFAILDPHGDLIDQILGSIPPNRIDDVVLIDSSDEQYSVGFNILSAHSELEKNLLASDLVSVFQRLSTSWGDQMGSVLQNAILAFLESDRGGTLADLRRFLLEPAFREQFLKTVRDTEIVYYWRKGFVQLSGNKSIGSVITRLNDFLAPKPIRYMVSQSVNRIDFANILDTGKIFLAKLSQGQMGRENSFLLGSLFVAKFQQTAMSRQAQQIAARRDFWLYIDEFQNFITPSMSEILTGARKYRLGLILAHQELRQLERDREVASAVLTHPYSRVIFRVGDSDARALEHGLSHFQAKDLQNLETGQAICRVEKSDNDFNLAIPFREATGSQQAQSTRQVVIAASRAKYATPRAEVEAALLAKLHSDVAEPEPVKPVPRPLPKVVEIPKNTVSEKEKLVSPPIEISHVPPAPQDGADKAAKAPAIVSVLEPSQSRDLGKGGPVHQAIQKRFKKAAEELGFLSTIERQIADSKQSVDLYLERDGCSIACEIALSGAIEREIGNVLKCLKLGCATVAMIAIDGERLQKLEVAVLASLGKEASASVAYFQPNEFIAYLKSIPLPAPKGPQPPKMTKGYKVKSSISKSMPEQRKQQEEAAIRAIAAAMRTPKKS